jgi:hypothetical protein
MQGNQTCLSFKIPMPRCLILPKTTVLSLALEQLIDLVGGRQCEEEFRKSLYQLSSWTAAVWKTMDYSELKKSLGELVQRCKKLLVRNLPTSSSSTTLSTSSPSTSTTRGDNAIDSESDEDTAAAPEMNRTLIGVPASATNMDQLYGILPSEQTVKVSTWPFQHAQQTIASGIATSLWPRRPGSNLRWMRSGFQRCNRTGLTLCQCRFVIEFWIRRLFLGIFIRA